MPTPLVPSLPDARVGLSRLGLAHHPVPTSAHSSAPSPLISPGRWMPLPALRLRDLVPPEGLGAPAPGPSHPLPRGAAHHSGHPLHHGVLCRPLTLNHSAQPSLPSCLPVHPLLSVGGVGVGSSLPGYMGSVCLGLNVSPRSPPHSPQEAQGAPCPVPRSPRAHGDRTSGGSLHDKLLFLSLPLNKGGFVILEPIYCFITCGPLVHPTTQSRGETEGDLKGKLKRGMTET